MYTKILTKKESVLRTLAKRQLLKSRKVNTSTDYSRDSFRVSSYNWTNSKVWTFCDCASMRSGVLFACILNGWIKLTDSFGDFHMTDHLFVLRFYKFNCWKKGASVFILLLNIEKQQSSVFSLNLCHKVSISVFSFFLSFPLHRYERFCLIQTTIWYLFWIYWTKYFCFSFRVAIKHKRIH